MTNKLLDQMIELAVGRGATDIHLLPGIQIGAQIAFRIDGRLIYLSDSHYLQRSMKHAYASVLAQIKIFSQLDLVAVGVCQDGAFNALQNHWDVRVSIIPFLSGQGVVMRLLRKNNQPRNLDEIGLEGKLKHTIEKRLNQAGGLVLATGPTGSGKTTSLYSMLSTIAKKRRIVTVEDPVEYQVDWLSQVCLHQSPQLAYQDVLRSFLRHDPQVIMVGEIRDAQSVQICCRAALTGHLVLSTLHTFNAASTLHRLHEMQVPYWLIKATLSLVIAQRLIPLLCQSCKQPFYRDETLTQAIPQALSSSRLPASQTDAWQHANGCDECLHTGEKGREAVFEAMDADQLQWNDAANSLQVCSDELTWQGKVWKLVDQGRVSPLTAFELTGSLGGNSAEQG